MPKYYPINEEAARRAKNANSFSDYVPGSATAAYREMVDRAYALGEQQKGRVDPMYHEKIDGLIDRYAALWRPLSDLLKKLSALVEL